MDILRPVNGLYKCINNPENQEKYMLLEINNCYPVLITEEEMKKGHNEKAHLKRYAVSDWSNEVCHRKNISQIELLIKRMKKVFLSQL